MVYRKIVLTLILAFIAQSHGWGFNRRLFKPSKSRFLFNRPAPVKPVPTTPPTGPLEGVELIPLSGEMKQEFVNAHNDARSTVIPSAADMQMVEWDDDIAAVAEKFVKKCDFKHSAMSERTIPSFPIGLGENLFVGMVKYHVKPKYITDKWNEERDFYDYNDLSCKPGKMCGHYTQVVWSTSTKIGCAIAKCPSIEHTSVKVLDMIAACHYGPGGNWKGMKPYKEGQPCSACPETADTCLNGLCS